MHKRPGGHYKQYLSHGAYEDLVKHKQIIKLIFISYQPIWLSIVIYIYIKTGAADAVYWANQRKKTILLPQ